MQYLINHAKANVWCNIGMDYQCTFKLIRLTNGLGDKREFTIEFNKYQMPSDNEFYHCFMLGHIPKTMIGISNKLFTNSLSR